MKISVNSLTLERGIQNNNWNSPKAIRARQLMHQIACQTRPEKILIPTGLQNAFLAVKAVRVALLTAMALATKLHTALDVERARGIVPRPVIRHRFASSNHAVALTKLVEIKRASESKRFLKVKGG